MYRKCRQHAANQRTDKPIPTMFDTFMEKSTHAEHCTNTSKARAAPQYSLYNRQQCRYNHRFHYAMSHAGKFHACKHPLQVFFHGRTLAFPCEGP